MVAEAVEVGNDQVECSKAISVRNLFTSALLSHP